MLTKKIEIKYEPKPSICYGCCETFTPIKPNYKICLKCYKLGKPTKYRLSPLEIERILQKRQIPIFMADADRERRQRIKLKEQTKKLKKFRKRKF